MISSTIRNRPPATRFAGVVAVFVACVLCLLVGPRAFAAPGPGDPKNVALINPAATTQLTIHKYAAVPLDQDACPADGTVLPAACTDGLSGSGLAGVEFTISRVNGVVLTTNAGWEAARAYAAATTAPTDLFVVGTYTTPAGGLLVVEDLPIGLYYVQETAAPAGVTRAAPFLVTLPMTDPVDRKTWMYDVHVYPKNTADVITKTVDDRGTQTTDSADGPAADHVVDFTVTTSISDGLTGTEMGQYEVYDDLDPRLTYTGLEVSLSGGTALSRCTASDATQTGCAYLVYLDGAFAASDPAAGTGPAGPQVRVVFTTGGLTTLAANAAQDVVTVIRTTLGDGAAAGATTGVIGNTASFIPNQAWATQNPGSTGTDSTPTESRYGDLQVLKHDAATPATVLEGAEFTLYRDANGDGTCAPDVMVEANRLAGPAATGANGVALFTGLQLSNYYNGAPQTDLTTYCLVETAAPDGFNLSAQPIPVTLTAATQQVDVPNEPSNLDNNLPTTGGPGLAAVSALSVLLIVGAVVYHLLTTRRRGEHDSGGA